MSEGGGRKEHGLYGSLEGRTAIVTGATGGIGSAVARRLAAAGASCMLVGRDEERGRSLVSELSSVVGARFERCDVSVSSEVERVVSATREAFGGVDILVNNAGTTRDGLLIRMKEEDWDRVLTVNLKSIYLFTRAATQAMVKARYGRIVSVSSIVGVHGNAGQSNYAASKAGIIGFTKSIAKELAARGITANVVAPGFVETAMTDALKEDARDRLRARIPVGRFGRPEDVANAVHFFAAPESSYVTGQVLGVDGLLSL